MMWRIEERRGGCLALGAALILSCTGCSPPAPPGIDPATYPETLDLTADRLPVLVRAATRRLDLGTPAARESLLEGWSGDEQLEDGTTFVWGVGSSSILRFDVLEPSDRTLRARVWPYLEPGSPRQEIGFELNGKMLGKRRVRPGLREVEIRLPAADQVAGVNLLTARYAWHRSSLPESPDPAGDPRALAVAWDQLTLGAGPAGQHASPRISAGALYLPFHTEVSFFFQPAGESVLAFSDLELSDSRGRLTVRIRGENDGAVAEHVVGADGAGAVLLEVEPGRLTRITLGAAAGRRGSGRGGINILQPTLRGRQPLIVPASWDKPAASGEGRPRAATVDPGSRPNVIVYMVDTLRADHLGCYGYARPTSPEIDAFAAGAVLFERTMAQSSWTRSSVASLLTGVVPSVHGVLGRGDALPSEALTLAEVLTRVGYSTAAFVTNGNVGEAFGFAQGFSHFELLGLTDVEALHSSAGAVNQAVFEWLDDQPREPFFLYVHVMEPHAPYAPPESARKLLAPAVESLPMPDEARQMLIEHQHLAADAHPVLGSVPWLQALTAGFLDADQATTDAMIALYDAEILATDQAFGELLERLRARDLYQRSLIALVSDHGEEFFEHGSWSHGRSLFQEQLEIALIVRFPGPGPPPAGRVEGLATQLDLVPTVIDLIGLERPPGAVGRNLRRLTRGDVGVPGYAQLDLDGRRAESLILGRWKLICAPCRLYDLASDPEETTDLAPQHPVRASLLEALMGRFRDPAAVVPRVPAAPSPELLRQLEALGYVN